MEESKLDICGPCSRRDFLKNSAYLAGLTALGLGGIKAVWPDIEIPLSSQEKIKAAQSLLDKLTNTVQQREGFNVPRPNVWDFNPLLIASGGIYPLGRFLLRFVNSEDIRPWLKDEDIGNYQYNYQSKSTPIVGGTPGFQTIAREIFNAYVKHDQYRVKEIELGGENYRIGTNAVGWEGGRFKDPKELSSDDLQVFLRSLVHELSHTGIPIASWVGSEHGLVLLPYGLNRSVDFVNMWLSAINANYDFFQKCFFRAPGDETLGFIKTGKVRRAIDEIIAMLCTDYVLPPKDTDTEILRNLKTFPHVETAIRKTIAYITYGVSGLEEFPDGITLSERGSLVPLALKILERYN